MKLFASARIIRATTFTIATLGLMSATFADSRDFQFGAISKIEASVGIKVVATYGENQKVYAEAADNDAFSHMELTYNNGTLIAKTNHNLLDFIANSGFFGPSSAKTKPITVYVTTPTLEGITVSSGATLDGDGFWGASLDSDVSTGGTINMKNIAYNSLSASAATGSYMQAAGTCSQLLTTASSGANIDLSSLICKTGNATVSTGANTSVNITDEIIANAATGGAIRIEGKPPKVDVTTSTGGNVSK